MHRLTCWLLRAFMLAQLPWINTVETGRGLFEQNSDCIAEMSLVMLITKVMLLLYINSVNYRCRGRGNTMVFHWGERGNSIL